MEALKQKGTQGYTYQCKTDKKFKVVLRNMHPSTDIKELKTEIENYNHIVIKITNILETRTKKLLPLFFIELQQKDNNKDIYKIRNLLNTIITFEQPYKKRDHSMYKMPSIRAYKKLLLQRTKMRQMRRQTFD